MNVAILGAGGIAGTMARTILGMKERDIHLYAIASRSNEKAEQFAKQYGIEKAYGSYEEMVQDEDVDLVYIATPHSHHYEHMKLCLEHGKHILCEKAFTINEKQAAEVFEIAKEKGLLVTEAIWTRYLPVRQMILDILDSGVIGEARSIEASLGYDLRTVERLIRPELAGGALLDIGVYPINFALMVFGDQVESIHSTAIMSEEGVDLMDSITLCWKGNKMAVLHATMVSISDRKGMIFCENGYIHVDNINNPQKLSVYNNEHKLIKEYQVPEQITGYEYEVYACEKAIKERDIECPEMTHEQTLNVMRMMDTMRKQWGMVYPMERE